MIELKMRTRGIGPSLRSLPTPSQPTSPPIKNDLKTHYPKQPHPKRKIKCTKPQEHHACHAKQPSQRA